MGFFTGSRTSASPSSCSNNFLVSTDRNDDLHSPFPVCRKVRGASQAEQSSSVVIIIFYDFYFEKRKKLTTWM